MSKLLLDEPPTLFYPGLAIVFGVDAAIFIQQLHWWLTVSDHIVDDRPWTYNSEQDWVDTTLPHLSLRTFQRMSKALVVQGVVLTRQLRASLGDQRKWYSLDYARITEVIDASEAYQAYRRNRASREMGRRRWQGL